MVIMIDVSISVLLKFCLNQMEINIHLIGFHQLIVDSQYIEYKNLLA